MSNERDSAIWALEVAERRYLRAHGWTLEPGRGWLPPAVFAFKRRGVYSRSHAVNAQKQLTYNAMFGGERSDADG